MPGPATLSVIPPHAEYEWAQRIDHAEPTLPGGWNVVPGVPIIGDTSSVLRAECLITVGGGRWRFLSAMAWTEVIEIPFKAE